MLRRQITVTLTKLDEDTWDELEVAPPMCTISSYRNKRVVTGTKKRVKAQFLVERPGFPSEVFSSRKEVLRSICHYARRSPFTVVDYSYVGKNRDERDTVRIDSRRFSNTFWNRELCAYVAGLMKGLE